MRAFGVHMTKISRISYFPGSPMWKYVYDIIPGSPMWIAQS